MRCSDMENITEILERNAAEWPEDVALVARQALCGTNEVAQLLGCTRQNVSDLVRRGKLPVCKADGRMQLFLRSDVLNRRS